MKYYPVLIVFLSMGTIFSSCGKSDPDPVPPPPANNTFKNPLINGSDPWVIERNDVYYYLHTLGNRIAIWKTNKMSKLSSATPITVFTPPAASANSQNVWAPELHFIDNKWYIYYTAGSGPDISQRTWVLENSNADPTTGTWTDKGRIFSSDADFWAIDGTVMSHNGSNYFIWSGRPDPAQQNQNLYIAKMTNPWTLQTPSTMISSPQLAWEVVGGPVNEGPQYLTKNGKHHIIYSASGCWTDDYALGRLTLKTNGDPLIAADWTKHTEPVFKKKPENAAYGPGHNAFFKSADGTEDWIIYHANSNTGEGCGTARNIRIQKFTWNADDTPNFGTPTWTGTFITLPSGEE